MKAASQPSRGQCDGVGGGRGAGVGCGGFDERVK